MHSFELTDPFYLQNASKKIKALQLSYHLLKNNKEL